ITIARGCALLAAAIGLLTSLEYLSGGDFGIDQLLVTATPEAGFRAAPGRMAPNTALSFVLVGAALSLPDAGSRWLEAVSRAFAVITLSIGYIAIVGYAYHTSALVGVAGYSGMAVHTAGGLVVLATGVLACRSHSGFMAILREDSPTGSSVRNLLPLIIAAPFAIGLIRLQGQYAGLYGTEFGVAQMVIVLTVTLLSAVLWNARALGHASETHEQA